MPGTFTYAAATNTVTVTGGTSGSPADFASFVAADRAGAGTSLLAAWSPNSNTKALTYQVRPVELLALLITFTIASKTAEADYIFITGTDWLGAAQTESINVSAGNGTYVSTKYFRTITNIDCSDNAAGGGTVWADGTVAVTQPIWGVIWNKGNGQYQLDSKMIVGNGSTSTYFRDYNGKQIFISQVLTSNWQSIITINVATFLLGTLYTLASKSTVQGCFISSNQGSITRYYLIYSNGNSNVGLYSCGFWADRSASQYAYIYLAQNSGYYGRIWNCIGDNITIQHNIYSDVYNTIVSNSGTVSNSSVGLIDKLTCIGCATDIYVASSMAITNVTTIDSGRFVIMGLPPAGGTFHSVDCVLDKYDILWSAVYGTWFNQNTLSLHLVDVAGNNISGATVILKDKDGVEVFNTTTGADGKITFAGEDSSPTAKAVTVTRYYYSGGTVADYRGPWTLTITKTGYQDYVDVITIDRKMDLEVAMKANAFPIIGGSHIIKPARAA